MITGHVNNVQYLRYAETSRINFFRHLLHTQVPAEHQRAWADLCSPRSEGLIMKSATVDFLLVSMDGFFPITVYTEP